MAPEIPAPDGSSPKQQRFDGPPPMIIDPAKRYTADMTTSKGTMTIALDPIAAPKTVNNFVFLARYHYYDGVVFHRIIPGFVLQGGDPEGTGRGGPGTGSRTSCRRPVVTRSARWPWPMPGPNTNGSQFFVISGPDGVGLPPSYSLFGKVVAGLDVVAAIEPTGSPLGQAVGATRHRVGHHHRGRLTPQRPAALRPGAPPDPPSARAPFTNTVTSPAPAARQVPSGSGCRAVRSGMQATGTPAGASCTDRCNLPLWTSSDAST